MEHLDLPPIAHMQGIVTMPGSKSISNRVLLLAALAEGSTTIRHLLAADDVERMLGALNALGVRVDRLDEPDAVRVHGVGGRIPVSSAKLDLGNAGTAFRPLTAVLALQGGDYTLRGTPRMHERPIGDLVDALRALGAGIRYLGRDGYPPLAIGSRVERRVPGVSIRGDVSSQFLSALLMALPLATRAGESPPAVDVAGELISKPYVELTLALMSRFGVVVDRDGWSRFGAATGSRYLSPGSIRVEGDASSASYFLAAGAIAGGPVRIEGAGRASVQGDVHFAEVLARMGARVEMGADWIEVAGKAPLAPIDADFNAIPDAAMTVAVAALFASGPSTLRNIGSWRVKETDRIAALATELGKLGAAVDAGADWMRITPPPRLKPATLDTYDDHRMAMSLSLAALGGVPIRINDPACVRKTFPDYFAQFARLAT